MVSALGSRVGWTPARKKRTNERTICTACFVVWQIHCAADTSTNSQRAWNRLSTDLKLLRSKDSFRRQLKTFLFESVYGHQRTDWSTLWCPILGGRNTNTSVTATVYCGEWQCFISTYSVRTGKRIYLLYLQLITIFNELLNENTYLFWVFPSLVEYAGKFFHGGRNCNRKRHACARTNLVACRQLKSIGIHQATCGWTIHNFFLKVFPNPISSRPQSSWTYVEFHKRVYRVYPFNQYRELWQNLCTPKLFLIFLFFKTVRLIGNSLW